MTAKEVLRVPWCEV